ncbi:MAG: glycoside hydrolase family 13 protein [Ornithinimicrobium sp.]|uniref:glycoside hydrolase family 13 protein n=1 Tax=Ornithinimicrobium sp. TaxID=1977084 RepID=UPI0026DEE047|nr:glycoside hydrolase family 13 protein [Ornithinimicrobium sp.]MDO5738938.1 glycoside hydrolase family 13 protein [Ornithinimicrobium sp.]
MTSVSPHAPQSHEAPWWRHAVLYQVYPRSFADSDGDGVGDLPGLTARLPYLADLGVDALWISPFYVSPMIDAGYDVADYRDVDPLFGTLADVDVLIEAAHGHGLRVLIDLVPNHTSGEHTWFRAALASGPGSPERERYLFREGRGEQGNEPPNNWKSVFGGSAWTRVTEADGTLGQWYLHLFDSLQPDLNWRNPQVVDEFHDVLRFWLDRGVDGFRVDVAHALLKDEAMPDWQEKAVMAASHSEGAEHANLGPMWDQDGVHEIYRAWRSILDSYNPQGDPALDRILCAEAWLPSQQRTMRYVRPDEMHQAFNFHFLETSWRAKDVRTVIDDSLEAADAVGAPTTWVLSNHDVVRHASRLGLRVGASRPNGIGARSVQPNAVLGLRRARAATALMLALPGSAYLYNGEELGLPEHTALPDRVRQDPAFFRTKGKEIGRDGCRVPLPWEAGAPSYGFGPSPDGATWLPQPLVYGSLAADRQEGVTGSTLEIYRSMLRLRRVHDLGVGGLRWIDGYGAQVLAFVNARKDGIPITVLTNLGDAAVALPESAEVLVCSGRLEDGLLPQDTTVWLAQRDRM